MREMNDFSAALREGSWIFGSIAAAIAFCYFAPEYGYDPVLFFSIAFYGLCGIGRFLFRALRRFKPK
jgi:hypothetical protein